jgi:hypothetical protein
MQADWKSGVHEREPMHQVGRIVVAHQLTSIVGRPTPSADVCNQNRCVRVYFMPRCRRRA